MSSLSHVLDRHLCEQARRTRDARFDGLFFVAVKTTGIYCRPICPAKMAHERNVEYFSSAAAAAAVGYRPCLRCRPEAAPGSPAWRITDAPVGRALRLIEEGVLDEQPVAALAARVGIGERYLRRRFCERLGASPAVIAATRRLLFAKQLLSETTLPITEVAAAAGYRSVRRFNAAFRASYGNSPSAVRRREERAPLEEVQPLQLRLYYRPPYDFSALLRFFSDRAIPGVEKIEAGSYQRLFSIDGKIGFFRVTASDGEHALIVEIAATRPTALISMVDRIRRLFDLDADAEAIGECLSADPFLRPLVGRHPGQRLPGAWDGFEVALRAVVGQQVSVAAARTLTARLVALHGQRVEGSPVPELNLLFPSAERIAEADLTSIGLTRMQAATLRTLSSAVVEGKLHFGREQSLDEFVTRATALPGIGRWTAHYVALRALGAPDAFPAADLVLRRAAGRSGPLSERAMELRGERWRPFRAYAVLHLWRSLNVK